MKAPPFLVGAALVFWGWQTGFLVAGIVMAMVLESARFVKARWELSNEDFRRIWTFCALLFLAATVYAFTASDGPASIGYWINNRSFSAQNAVGNVTARTAVLLTRWLPLSFFLFVAAQAFSDREGVPLETISLILQRRWKKAQSAGLPLPKSRAVNVTYPYFMICLLAATGHPATPNDGFLWGACILLGWALWAFRSRRFGVVVWAGTLCLAVVMGYAGQRGLLRLKQIVEQYNPSWLSGSSNSGFDPFESRTEIGQIGRIKASSEIIIRLEPEQDAVAPNYLRAAVYRTYSSGVWYLGKVIRSNIETTRVATNANPRKALGSAADEYMRPGLYIKDTKDDFAGVTETPVNSGNWPLIPGKLNAHTVNIACYLPGGKGLLPLPESIGQLTNLPAFTLQKNDLGSVRAEGPGLVIFDAQYGPGAIIDQPPDTNDDLTVPDREKPGLDETISELHLDTRDHTALLDGIRRYFGARFTYTLWQPVRRTKDTNSTALGRFLLKTHTGHCEYFATATVLLLRELRVPARYTVGYAVHESTGNRYVVRHNDAHAWCRVWNEQRRTWEDFDTTPGTWFDMEREQRSEFQFLSDAWSRVAFEFSKFRWGQSHLREYILWALMPVLALLLYQIIFRSGKRRAAASAESITLGISRPGLDSEFYAVEKALAKRGLTRPASEPLSIWIQRIAADPALTVLTEPMARLLRLHYRYRFDPQGLSHPDREIMRQEVAICISHFK
ncbi:MAG TPA: transglutaminase domain-containing protein [Verrucomicrobiae bacterium]|nr:transglutaminase domain-containing protein [Verrucomicrobiae bacterium]